MPKTSKIDVVKLIEVIKKFQILNEDTNKIKGPGQSCWARIQNEMDNTVTAKYIYTIVLQNRFGILDKLGLNEKLKQNSSNNSPNNSKADLISSEEDNCIYSSGGEDIEDILNFNITLSPQEWIDIKEEKPVKYKRSDGKNFNRSYEILKPHKWTNVINEHFYEQTKLPCCVAYKHAKINTEGQIYLKIIGSCIMCLSNLKGIVEHAPEENSRVVITCTIKGHFQNCLSEKKRRVTGNQREMFLDKLMNCNMSAAYLQRLEAKQKMNYGDKEPSSIPTLNALRVMKYKEQKNNQVHNDPILAVSLMKGMLPYNTIFHDIGYDRFYLHYWSSSEVNSYRNYSKRTQIPTICIDATGALVKRVTLINGRETGQIFLYQIGVNDFENSCQFSVAHMLSERHDHNSIGHWLTEWCKNSIAPPKIVVTDQSLALMMAVVKTFTQYSTLNKYISVCSDLIMKKDVEIPSCMLRNDFNHIMHLISSWSEFKTTTVRIKNFYMRSICLIIVSMDFEDVKNVLKHVFTVALHETDGQNYKNEPTACENSKKYLKQRIATHETEFDEAINVIKDLNESNEIDLQINNLPNTSIFEEIKYIYNNCIESSNNISNNSGDRDNMQFCPGIAKKLFNFCKLIPCWSSLMVPIFKYGGTTESSSTSESLFKDLKTVVFKHKTLPLRLDDFLKIHINSIIGSTNILASKRKYEHQSLSNDSLHSQKETLEENQVEDSLMLNQIPNLKINEQYQSPTKKIFDIKEPEFPYYDDQEVVENWKGLGYAVGKKKKKGTYLDKDPTVLIYNDTSKTKSRVIGILRNGNFADLKNIIIDGQPYSVTNTCTFDSIVHIICTSYTDSTSYSTWINVNNNYKFFSLIENLIRDGVNTQTYRKRANILKDIMADYKIPKNVGGIMVLDASCTAHYLLNKLFQNYPSLQEQKNCRKCNFDETISHPIINAYLPTENLNFMLDILKSSYEENKLTCTNCKQTVTKTVIASEHLIIEPILPTNIKKFNNDASVKLSEIPIILHIFEKIYFLRGLICFIAPPSMHKDAIGHYVSFNWRNTNNNWERYDDLLNSVRNVRPSTMVHNCQFIIYTL